MPLGKRHVCDECGFVATHHAGLSSHRRNAHGAAALKPKKARIVVEPVFRRGDIVVKLICPFCNRSFGRRSWFDKHNCGVKDRFGKGFEPGRTLPMTRRLTLHLFQHGAWYVSFLSHHAERGKAEAEFRSELEVIAASGKRPSDVLLSRAAAAEMTRTGYSA